MIYLKGGIVRLEIAVFKDKPLIDVVEQGAWGRELFMWGFVWGYEISIWRIKCWCFTQSLICKSGRERGAEKVIEVCSLRGDLSIYSGIQKQREFIFGFWYVVWLAHTVRVKSVIRHKKNTDLTGNWLSFGLLIGSWEAYQRTRLNFFGILLVIAVTIVCFEVSEVIKGYIDYLNNIFMLNKWLHFTWITLVRLK